MKNILRIIGVLCIIGGGLFFFREWALKEFNSTFASLDASFESTESTKQVANSVQAFSFNTASTSEDVLATTTPVEYTGPDNFLFTTPRKNAVLYNGCTYPVSWVASSSINQLKLSVVDVGTQKKLESSVSDLSEEITGENIDNVEWKVGARVRPGEYFLQLTSLNNKEIEEKSYRFKVKAISATVAEQDRENICEDSLKKI
jgi:hypothetical protein